MTGVSQESVRSQSGVSQESVRSQSGVRQESVRSQSGVSQESVRTLRNLLEMKPGLNLESCLNQLSKFGELSISAHKFGYYQTLKRVLADFQ